MRNEEIKAIMKTSRFFNYEIASNIGVSEIAFSQWFRKELTDEQQNKIIAAIEELKKG